MRSKIKNQTSSCNKARLAWLCPPIILIYFKNQTFQEGCPKNQSWPRFTRDFSRFPISEIAQRSSGAKLYTGLFAYYYIKKWEQSDIGGAYYCMKPINLFAKYTVHYKIDFCVSDSVVVWRLSCTLFRTCCDWIERDGGKVKILKRRLQEIAI